MKGFTDDGRGKGCCWFVATTENMSLYISFMCKLKFSMAPKNQQESLPPLPCESSMERFKRSKNLLQDFIYGAVSCLRLFCTQFTQYTLQAAGQ